MMSRKNINIISICILFIFVIAILYFSISIAVTVKKEKNNASLFFDSITNQIIKTIENTTLKQLEPSIDFVIQEYSNINFLIIKDSNTEYYKYPYNNYIPKNTSPVAQSFSTSIPFFNDKTVILTTNLSVLTSDKIYSIAKITFIIIFIFTCLTFLLIFIFQRKFNYTTFNKEESQEDVFYNDKITDNYNATPSSHQNNNIVNFDDNFNNVDIDIVDYVDDTKDVDNVEVVNNVDNFNTIDNFNNVDNFDENYLVIDSQKEEENPCIQNDIYSQTSNFVLEKYLNDEIESEIELSLQKNKNLAIILLSINDLSRESEYSKEIIALIDSMFTPRSNIFEYKDDSYIILLNNIEMNKIIQIAKTIFCEVKEVLQSLNIPNNISIGISALNGRNISSERFIAEASSAAEKAVNNTNTSIVVYKS